MAVDAPTCQHQSTVDMEPEAPRDPALHTARLFYGLRRGDGTVFRSPRFLHSDHRAIVMNVRVGRTGWLKKYWRARQKFPQSLPPKPKDANTALFDFDALAASALNPNKCGRWERRLVLILAGALFYATVSFVFFYFFCSVQKYSI